MYLLDFLMDNLIYFPYTSNQKQLQEKMGSG